MARRTSLGWPITLGVVMIVLLVTLIIFWIIVTVQAASHEGYRWAFLAIGTTFLALVLIGVVAYLIIAVKEIRLNERQSNFIDSVTHELKSPIASLKLYVQTLGRRTVSEEEQADFYRFMLEDIDRLDTLINHMLDAAKLVETPLEGELEPVELNELLENCAKTACAHFRQPIETVQLNLQPAVVVARPIDVDMLFRNLIDNALKYAGDKPEVLIDLWTTSGNRVITRISDNGPGIPAHLRRKVFGRFVRLGSELERSRTGTGLGLFIVRTLVKRLKGRVTVRGRGSKPGTVFEVDLPGQSIAPRRPAGEALAQADSAPQSTSPERPDIALPKSSTAQPSSTAQLGNAPQPSGAERAP